MTSLAGLREYYVDATLAITALYCFGCLAALIIDRMYIPRAVCAVRRALRPSWAKRLEKHLKQTGGLHIFRRVSPGAHYSYDVHGGTLIANPAPERLTAGFITLGLLWLIDLWEMDYGHDFGPSDKLHATSEYDHYGYLLDDDTAANHRTLVKARMMSIGCPPLQNDAQPATPTAPKAPDLRSRARFAEAPKQTYADDGSEQYKSWVMEHLRDPDPADYTS